MGENASLLSNVIVKRKGKWIIVMGVKQVLIVQ